MSQIPLTIKIDADIKHQAQAVSKKLGLSLSTVIENKLREVIRERRVVFEEDLTSNKETAKQLKQIEKDVKTGRNLSRPFQTVEELEHYLSQK